MHECMSFFPPFQLFSMSLYLYFSKQKDNGEPKKRTADGLTGTEPDQVQKKKQKIQWSNKNRFVSFPCTGKTVGFGPKPCRYSNPPVLAGNLPFSGIIFILPFSLQNLPFFVFLEKSKICYSYCPKFSKNSTLNAS